MKRLTLIAMIVTMSAVVLLAQRYGRGGGRGGGEGWLPEDANVKTAREVPTHSYDMPIWSNTPTFDKDVFTFVRVQYHRGYKANGARRAGYCFTDFPDSDLNLSYRLQQLTSIKVDPDGRVLHMTDPELLNYPFIYMVEPGALEFDEPEVQALRRYLLNGGFLMADDFWGWKEWQNFEEEIKRALPEREYKFDELEMNDAVFHTVFQINVPKNQLQVPNFVTG